MYAVIASGGKQEKVQEGETINVELIKDAQPGKVVDLRPVMIVDGGKVSSGANGLKGAKVTAEVIGEVKGKKIRGFTYKNKSRSSKRWGHRQRYTALIVKSISAK